METKTNNRTLGIDLLNEILEAKEITVLLYNLTGSIWSFAYVSSRKWGSEKAKIEHCKGNDSFCQLMPDDTPGLDFFDWYCNQRPYNQFFKDEHTCAIHFIHYWMRWESQSLEETSGMTDKIKQPKQDISDKIESFTNEA